MEEGESRTPADKAHDGSLGAMMRLFRMVGSWRQRRGARRRAKVHSFMGLSDRALADIGVRRAEVHAAAVGAMPLGRHATIEAEGAAVCRLPVRPRLRVVTDNLDAAA